MILSYPVVLMLELKAKIGTRGQVVIPKPIREMFQIRSGEYVFFRVSKSDILIRKGAVIDEPEPKMNNIENKEPDPEDMDWNVECYYEFEE